jgi:hypothetical protein
LDRLWSSFESLNGKPHKADEPIKLCINVFGQAQTSQKHEKNLSLPFERASTDLPDAFVWVYAPSTGRKWQKLVIIELKLGCV